MRQTMFGDTVIENAKDDLGEAIVDHEAGTIHAVIREDEPGKFSFEIMENENGEGVASSDAFFGDINTARTYLRGWLPSADIQVA